MKISKKVTNDIMVITIDEKEANLSKSEQFKDLVLQEVSAGSNKILISFVNVEYIDSSFLGALVSILKALLPKKGILVLSNMNDDILNLFQLTRLDKIFTLKDNLDNALMEF